MSASKTRRSGSVQSATSSTGGRSSCAKATLLDKCDSTENLIPYKITVNSGNRKSNVASSCLLRIVGANDADTGRILMETNWDCPGVATSSIEHFNLDAPDIGKLKEIEVNIHNESQEECYIKDIVVSQPTRGRSFVFRINDNLRSKNSDRRTYAVDSYIATKPKVPYDVFVYTGDVAGAGTQSDVTLKLFGTGGSTEPFILPKVEDRFERGTQDKIRTELDEIGSLKRLRVNIDPGHEWFLDKIELLNLTTNKRYTFPCYKWFSETQSDGLLKRDLTATNDKGKPLLKSTAYTITVKTSDIRGAGTDANVACLIFGENGDSDELPLRNSLTHRDKFERGNIDQFLFPDFLSLGHLHKLRIWHDNSGLGASWHLDSVTVYDDKMDTSYVFSCKQWLSTSEGERMLCRELICDAVNRHTSIDRNGYEIAAVTGDKPEAETYNHVWIVLHGDEGSSDAIWFHNSSTKTLLRRGQTDVVYFPCNYLGVLRHVTIGHYPRDSVTVPETHSKSHQWYCEEVAVTEPSGKKYFFPCRKWILLSEDDKDAVKLKQIGHDTNGVSSIVSGNPDIVQYELSVFTGDRIGAGTDANVFCTVYGENGDTGSRHLTQKYRNLFERNQRDSFILESQTLGKLKKLYIEHDSTGFGSSWYLDRVEVKNLLNGEITTFPCSQWLKSAGDGRLAGSELLPAGMKL